ncbi:hypothetical protein ACWD6P_17745 [Streptomyces sp. NPDC002446]
MSEPDEELLPITANGILGTSLAHVLDLIRAQVGSVQPRRIACVVGTQINGSPHLGTALVQAAAFLLAQQAHRTWATDTAVRFIALDNAEYEKAADPVTGRTYRRTYVHALGADAVAKLIDAHYRPLLDGMSAATGVPYSIETYSDQQASQAFRTEFLHSQTLRENLRWWLAPSTGTLQPRLPCPTCGWQEAEQEAELESTRLLRLDERGALFGATCRFHGAHELLLDVQGSGYLDLPVLYRNVIKERTLATDAETVSLVLKGSDWAYAVQPVDRALALLGTPPTDIPVRIFTPQVLHATGSVLSKSMLKTAAPDGLPAAAPWMLSWTNWPESTTTTSMRCCGWSATCSPTPGTSSAPSP